ncbi:MAG TPA: 4-hydroxy-tetrahydrodipicolinate reductase [Longimicrobiales bacterium]|nr:4-hydroxy-tetrahydrodipicolinate reductase [Longimicrobiales bacterium]
MRILLLGHGVMGHTVEGLADDAGHVIAGRVDREDPPLTADTFDADVAIEFAGPDGAPSRIRQAVAAGLPVVSGSTGWDDDFDDVRRTVEEHGGALLHAPNLSIGVAVFERVVRRAAQLLDMVPDYRLELEETHHTRKVDHPSGTARWLADAVVQHVSRLEGWSAQLMPGRDESPVDDAGQRDLPVRSYREGDVPGTHVLRASGPDDVIELTHRALNRDGFARGAIRAAEWLPGHRGVYTLDDMLDDLLTTTPSDTP